MEVPAHRSRHLRRLQDLERALYLMSSTADEMEQRKNSTLVFDLEEEHLEEDSDLVRNGNVAMAQDGGNGTTTSLDEEAQARSNGTKAEFREDRMTEAPKTSAPTVSSNITISDATAVESRNITFTEGLENGEQIPVRNNATAYELESYGDANTTTSQEFQAAIPTKSTISEATFLSSSNQTLANIASEVQPSNFTEALVAPVDGNASLDVPEMSSPQNITIDSPPMMPNATLPLATELLAESTTNITSSTGSSTLSETVPEKDETSNTTLIGSAPSATNATFNLVFPTISAANSSSPDMENAHGAAHLDGLGNNSSFMPRNHSADILSILAGNSTPPPLNNTGAGALVVFAQFALPSNQQNALNSGAHGTC